MAFFNFFNRKAKLINESVKKFDELWNNKDISSIWKIEDKNDFVISLYGYLSEKCKYSERIENLSLYERTFYLCQVFEGEINNGGFSQFFYNSSGNFAIETIGSLVEIGGVKTSELLIKSISVFPNSQVPKLKDEREELLDEILNEQNSEMLETCDNAFYKYEDNLLDLNYNYLMSHKGDFLNE